MADEFGDSLARIVGEKWVQRGDAIDERYRKDLTGKYATRPGWAVRPGSTAEVSAMMRAAQRGGRSCHRDRRTERHQRRGGAGG
jgi:hypothetical protein